MPYIVKTHRHTLDLIAEQVPCAISAGEFNYLLTKIMIRLCSEGGYPRINDVTGALECCKLEFYRRLAAPYENEKIKENGDVYGPSLRFNVYVGEKFEGICELEKAPEIGKTIYFHQKWYEIVGVFFNFVSFLRLKDAKLDTHEPVQYRGILPIRES